ncbi:hypothetical protein AAMO2058_001270800 [Amorphochlora amoebiformis]
MGWEPSPLPRAQRLNRPPRREPRIFKCIFLAIFVPLALLQSSGPRKKGGGQWIPCNLASAPPAPPTWSKDPVLPEAAGAKQVKGEYQSVSDVPWASGSYYAQTPHTSSYVSTFAKPQAVSLGVKPTTTDQDVRVPVNTTSTHSMGFPLPPMKQQLTPYAAVQHEVNLMVYVGHLPMNVSLPNIMRLLRACGPLKSFEQFKDKFGNLRNFGFATYTSERAALRAIKCLNGLFVEGSNLHVKCDPDTSRLLDEHIEFRLQQQELFQAFPDLAQTPNKKRIEEYPGQFEDEKLKEDLRKMSSEIYEAELKKNIEKHKKLLKEDTLKKEKQGRERAAEEATKKRAEEEERREQMKILEELKEQDRIRQRLDKKRQRKQEAKRNQDNNDISLVVNSGGEMNLEVIEQMQKENEQFKIIEDVELGRKLSEEQSQLRKASSEVSRRKEAKKKRLNLPRPPGKAGESLEEYGRQERIPISRLNALIKEIPLNRTQVFEYPISWKLYLRYRTIVETTVSKFVTTKVKELLGQEEQSLVDYIMDKLEANMSAQELFEDLESVFDVDTEVFIIKLYRLIIFEIEKLKLR